MQSLKARCHRQSGPLSALGTAPAGELVWALVFVRVVGLGPTAGVLAIALRALAKSRSLAKAAGP